MKAFIKNQKVIWRSTHGIYLVRIIDKSKFGFESYDVCIRLLLVKSPNSFESGEICYAVKNDDLISVWPVNNCPEYLKIHNKNNPYNLL